MILLLLSILAGVLTVLAPCTISLLPVIVGGTLAGQRSGARALRVTAALGVSVVIFTILLKASTLLIQVPPVFWQYFSGTIIVAMGIFTIFPSLYYRLPLVNRLNRSSSQALSAGFDRHTVAGDFVVGAALGPVFSSCSPTYFLIVAAVLPRSFAIGLVDLLAYAFGLCGALLIIALAGQKLLAKFRIAANPHGWFKRALGILFIIVGVAIVTGYDKRAEVAVAEHTFDVTKIEQALIAAETRQPQAAAAPAVSPGAAPAAPAAQTLTTQPTTMPDLRDPIVVAGKALSHPRARKSPSQAVS